MQHSCYVRTYVYLKYRQGEELGITLLLIAFTIFVLFLKVPGKSSMCMIVIKSKFRFNFLFPFRTLTRVAAAHLRADGRSFGNCSPEQKCYIFHLTT